MNILDIFFYPSQKDFITNSLLAKLVERTGVKQLKINKNGVDIYNVKMTGQFMLHIKVSVVVVVGGGSFNNQLFLLYISVFWGVKPALNQKIKKRN